MWFCVTANVQNVGVILMNPTMQQEACAKLKPCFTNKQVRVWVRIIYIMSYINV